MKNIDPFYIRILIIVLALWVVSTTIYFADLYTKVGKIEHALCHMEFEKCETLKAR